MANDVTVLIADAQRMAAVRADAPIPGTVLYFSDSNLASALESIRGHVPGLVALESEFAATDAGRRFVDRLRELTLEDASIRILGRANGAWSTSPMAEHGGRIVAASSLNTRRTPRFQVITPTTAAIDGAETTLVDVSRLGAQVVLEPALKPSQRIRVTIVEDDEVLKIVARVAWSMYEKPRDAPAARYRAGMEFDHAAEQALAEFCRRHCAESPLPVL